MTLRIREQSEDDRYLDRFKRQIIDGTRKAWFSMQKHERTLLRTITRDKHKNSSYNINNRADDNDYDINDRNDRRDGQDSRVLIFYVHQIVDRRAN